MDRPGQHFDLFDLLRVIASVAIIYWHSYALTGRGLPVLPLLGRAGATWATLGVGAFFAMSGFLVTSSWLRNSSASAYVRNRILRIFPGLLVCVLITVCAVGPIVTSVDLSSYVRDHSTRSYLIHNTLLYDVRFNLPGVFAANPYPGSVNGSLWTLPYEVVGYVVLMLGGLAGLLRRQFVLGAVAGLALLHWMVVDHQVLAPRTFAGLTLFFGVQWALYFAIGSACRFYVDEIGCRRPLLVAGALLLMVAGVAARHPLPVTLGFALLVIVVGTQQAQLARRVRRLGDPSYGTYIYAFPIQQSLVNAGWVSTPLTMFAVATPAALAAGYASWHLIERRALAVAHARSRKHLAPQ